MEDVLKPYVTWFKVIVHNEDLKEAREHLNNLALCVKEEYDSRYLGEKERQILSKWFIEAKRRLDEKTNKLNSNSNNTSNQNATG